MIPKVEILNNSKKKKTLLKLNESFGISKLKHLFIKVGKNKYRIFSGSLSKEELHDLLKIARVELIGSRLCTIDDEDVRLNIDLMNLPEIKKQITENIFKLEDKYIDAWLRGNNLEIPVELKGKFIAIKNGKDFLGMGRNQKVNIHNYVPKERRIVGK